MVMEGKGKKWKGRKGNERQKGKVKKNRVRKGKDKERCMAYLTLQQKLKWTC